MIMPNMKDQLNEGRITPDDAALLSLFGELLRLSMVAGRSVEDTVTLYRRYVAAMEGLLKEQPPEPEVDPIAHRELDTFPGLNNRQKNAFKIQFYKTVADLGDYNVDTIYRLWGISRTSAHRVVEALNAERQRVKAQKGRTRAKD